MLQFISTSTSSLCQHVLDLAPVAAVHFFLQFLLVQPLEVLETELICLEVYLASHDTRLQEEGLCAVLLESSGGTGFGVVELVVAYWDVADEPGVHVYSAGGGDDAVCGLGFVSISFS
jgi:hypothetical protein